MKPRWEVGDLVRFRDGLKVWRITAGPTLTMGDGIRRAPRYELEQVGGVGFKFWASPDDLSRATESAR